MKRGTEIVGISSTRRFLIPMEKFGEEAVQRARYIPRLDELDSSDLG